MIQRFTIKKQIKRTEEASSDSFYFCFKCVPCINNSELWFYYEQLNTPESLDVEGRISSQGAAALAPAQNHKPVRRPTAWEES